MPLVSLAVAAAGALLVVEVVAPAEPGFRRRAPRAVAGSGARPPGTSCGLTPRCCGSRSPRIVAGAVLLVVGLPARRHDARPHLAVAR
ncbi:hypothetical protein HBB16_21510 [Pseudonocardia sp. MCCB 268]|nr:hypothetical protein [Pseudonocardia cytotoxica]